MHDRRALTVAVVIFALIMGSTVFVIRYVGEKFQEKSSFKFESEHRRLTTIAQVNFDRYIHILKGVRGLFAASNDVSREEFNTYLDQLDLPVNFPALQAVSYVRVVRPEEREAFLKEVRAERSALPGGGAGFAITPEGGEGDAYPILYIVPEAATGYGFDLASDVQRAELLRFARDVNEPVASSVLRFITGEEGFLLTMPVYRHDRPHATLDERRENIVGFVNGVFGADRFVSDILLREESLPDGFGLAFFQGKDDSDQVLLGEAGAAPSSDDGFSADDEFRLYGQTWHLHYNAPPRYGLAPFEMLFGVFVGFAGLAVAGLLFFLFLLLASSRSRALELARGMTKNLEAASFRLEDQKIALEVLVESLPVGVLWIKAPDGDPLMINRVGAEMIGRGIDRDARPGAFSKSHDIIREDGSPYPDDELPAVIALREGRTVVKSDTCVRKPDGTVIVLRTLAAPIRDANGQTVSVVLVMDDITKEREVERQKQEFLFVASHQLRTPLTAIKWLIEMLVRGDAGKLNAEQRTFLTQAYESNGRMIGLVNDLLNVSRLESGVIEVAPKPTDLGAMVKEVVDEVRPIAKEKKQKLTVEIAALPPVAIDAHLIHQALLNLLSNAVKYTPPKGSVSLTVTKDKVFVRFEVRDTGLGIPAVQRPSIFKKFFRAENAIGSGEEGTGLGLYICKQIVELSGGLIGFETAEGVGSTFWFTLPLEGSQPKKGSRSVT